MSAPAHQLRGADLIILTSEWLQHIQAWSTLAAAVVAFLGLGGVIYNLYQTRRDQRVQWGPYIRIDVCAEKGSADFRPPDAHFWNQDLVVDLAPDEPEDFKVTLSAWVRNYQPHPLGFALALSAYFVVETHRPPSGGQAHEVDYFELKIPYVEHGKTVRVDLFRLPREWTAFLWLASLAFYDFYDRRHEHYHGQSTNALHGRLSCEYLAQTARAIPEARPRGPKVDFE